MKTLYFGRWDISGHYLYKPNGYRADHGLIPWADIDGGLCHQDIGQKQGIAKLHHKGNWTALAFWDRSGDNRMNSNSVFFAEGKWTHSQMIKNIINHFPCLYERFSFVISRKK